MKEDDFYEAVRSGFFGGLRFAAKTAITLVVAGLLLAFFVFR